MSIAINDDICKKYGLTLSEVLAILFIKTCSNIYDVLDKLESKQVLIKDISEGYLVTQRWDDVVSNIILDSDSGSQSLDRITNLTSKLMEVFPKEKKVGTSHYFRCNSKDVSLKLKKFFKLYGNKYTDEQIINAAKAYVSSFNGIYTYMRILKYFIWKPERKVNEEGKVYIEETSDLATWIENEGVTENSDWMTTMV